MDDNIKVYNLADLEAIELSSTKYAKLGDSYIACRLGSKFRPTGMLDKPLRFNGLMICLVKEGSFEGELDFKKFTMTANSVIAFGRNSVIKLPTAPSTDLIADLIFIDLHFLRDLNMDMMAINIQSLVENKSNHVMQVTNEEAYMMGQFFSLLYHNAKENADTMIAKNIARSLTEAFFYELIHMHSKRTNRFASTDVDASQTRQVAYVHEFIRLLQLHHVNQRSVSFYADKLFISPKYLSHLVKETTGKSAADWIGEFVISAAKNLLRFSNKNVQQVAYALNFSSQSSFGKYFKHITGMSPSEFQKA